MAQAGQKQVKLTDLQPQQLGSLKEQLEAELDGLAQSANALQNFAEAFHQSGEAVEGLEDQKPGAPMLLPLTQSLYVEGELADAENVLIDIGTGYYLEKPLAGGIDYFKRRVQELADNLQEIQKMRSQKAQMLMAVEQILQQKVAAQQQQQRSSAATVNAASATVA
mmetsp:Transcript_4621/g.13284  ORF Transcript_4621/g.13284 Transcript_4621/m.13284 type:complete len:166 (-) Transcript_4621:475-972(-)|eukprot:CAMPEP_0206138522 /NCGR_PEP_ID=MMETSP1473-20131121/3380_1 /ASSEMBLY_ACC=CAM_ASM_001109 /TAXON_ID=1461547 /ORGANISM="Stichococcus sp, Strain RCC1054" /LENGTH=165 /DNA_ID=CAMNT_0053531979 /DNA_START=566 /DNA_END=1063 /DNA_ORIENTATION=-